MDDLKNFYFHIQKDWGEFSGCKTLIAFMDIKDFNESGSMNHIHLQLDKLPSDFEEAMEAVYGCDRSVNDIREELLSLGCIESAAFSKEVASGFDSEDDQ